MSVRLSLERSKMHNGRRIDSNRQLFLDLADQCFEVGFTRLTLPPGR